MYRIGRPERHERPEDWRRYRTTPVKGKSKLTKGQYTASVKTSTLDQTAKALSSLNDILKADRKLPAILRTPTLTVSDKQQIVAELQKLIGDDKGGTMKNFLNTLAENNRLGVLEDVCNKFDTLMGAHRGEIELNVTSAQVFSVAPV